jgi:AraC-like DNA-binding protein
MFVYEREKFGSENFYSIFFAQDLSWPMHLHRCYECICLNSGKINLIIDGKSFLLQPGETAFLCPNQLHSLQTIGSSEITILQFSPEIIGHFSTRFQNRYPIHPILSDTTITTASYTTNNLYLRKSFTYEICAKLTEQTSFKILSYDSLEDNVLLKMFQFIDLHFEEKCSLAQISSELGYDYAYLSKCFKCKTGLSFKEYLNAYRIHRACMLLGQNILSISEVAMQCGYQSIRSFNRNFLEIIGKTPREYRMGL